MMRNLYLVCYDIADPKRWRKVHKIMVGHGESIQLSVFLCALSPTEFQRLIARLYPLLHTQEDALATVDMGPEGTARERLITFGTVHWEGGSRRVVV